MGFDNIPFRNQDGQKIWIDIQSPQPVDNAPQLIDYPFIIKYASDDSFRCVLRFSNKYIKKVGIKPSHEDRAAISKIVMDLILGSRFDPQQNAIIKFMRSDIDPIIEGDVSAEEGTGKLLYQRNIDLIIFENRIARKLVLEKAYYLASVYSGVIPTSKLIEECHYSRNSIELARNYMISAGLLKNNPSGGDGYIMTHMGQAKYEETFIRYGDSIFLIAACNSEITKMIDEVYRPIIQDEVHLKLIFQEKEEPQKTIHEDIYDYIENCKFIIADLSAHRANCYFELGYARAKGKQIILAIKESDAKDERGVSTLAFDTTPLRYSFYKIDDLESFKTELRERVEIVLGRVDGP